MSAMSAMSRAMSAVDKKLPDPYARHWSFDLIGSPAKPGEEIYLTKQEVFVACSILWDAELVLRKKRCDKEATELAGIFELMEGRLIS